MINLKVHHHPFITLLRAPNSNAQIEEYADSVRVSYDNMKIPRVGLRIEEIGKNIESQKKVCETINEIKENKSLDSLSAKLKEISDLIDSKYETRHFKEEISGQPQQQQQQNKVEEEPPITTDP